MNPAQIAETLQSNNETAPTSELAASAAAANGKKNDGEIIPFMARRDELFHLARYWAAQAINDELYIFEGVSFGSSDADRISLAWGRVSEIGRILGREAVDGAIREAEAEIADGFLDASNWIVFRYGTPEERSEYEDERDQCPKGFRLGTAEKLASKVTERVFREAPAETQEILLKQELRRYARKFRPKAGDPHHVIEIFGIYFPSPLEPMVLGAGIADPDPNSQTNTFTHGLALERGKAVLAALKKAVRECKSASSARVKQEKAAE